MLAVCFESISRVYVNEVPDPTPQREDDAVVAVRLAGLCGSDLHPFFGRETGLDPGTVMGHEFVGEVVACGTGVRGLHIGDRVSTPFTTNCGDCYYCNAGLTSRCRWGELFGWRSGGVGLDGGQSRYVRVPRADTTLMKVPPAMSDETALLLGDNLSTGYFAAELASVDAADLTVVIGCGTVGLMAITAAADQGAGRLIAIDPNPARVAAAQQWGASGFTDAEEAVESVYQWTDGRGADSVIELVGLPAAAELAYRLIRPGGTMSVIGCHCEPHFAFSPAQAYDKNLTIRTGRCPARHYMGKLADWATRRSADVDRCITHRFGIDQGREAYDTFAHGKDGCLKAVLEF
jgi:threonine dehydrogenase-like Zn-dependent dehydrogenase